MTKTNSTLSGGDLLDELDRIVARQTALRLLLISSQVCGEQFADAAGRLAADVEDGLRQIKASLEQSTPPSTATKVRKLQAAE
jgi:hypothetical protein